MIIQLTIGGQTKRSTFGQHPTETDFDALPDASKEFIIRYGLKQYLADAMAGAENEADAKARIEARHAKLLSGDLSRTRGEGGDKPDSVETRALKLARSAIRAALKAQNKTADKEAIGDAAKKMVANQPKWKAEATKQLAAEAKTAQALIDDDSADILADLLSE